MSRIRTGSADLDGLPVAFTRGHGKPIGWHEGARCRDERAPRAKAIKGGGYPSVWLVEPDRKYRFGPDILKGDQLQAMACLECSLCSVQWDCARFAVAVVEPMGVWAMMPEDREWLQGQPDVDRIIQRAESAGRPIQFAVTSLRRRRP